MHATLLKKLADQLIADRLREGESRRRSRLGPPGARELLRARRAL